MPHALGQAEAVGMDVGVALVAAAGVLTELALGGDAGAVDAEAPVVMQGEGNPDALGAGDAQNAEGEADQVVGVDDVRFPGGDDVLEVAVNLRMGDIVAGWREITGL